MSLKYIFICSFIFLLTFCKSMNTPQTQSRGDAANAFGLPAPNAANAMTPAAAPTNAALIENQILSSPNPIVKDLQGNGQLTFQGNNRTPHYSPNDKEILFTSSQRISHKEAQIYNYNLATNLEHRITFNDGINQNPQFNIQGNLIFYNSTTDEQKEYPQKIYSKDYLFLIQKFWDFEENQIFLNSEIYSLSLDSKDKAPQRYTNHFGFDGFPVLLAENAFYFTQKNKTKFSLFKSDLKHQKEIHIWEQINPIWKPEWNEKNHQWAWISWDPKLESSVLQNQVFLYEPSLSKTPETLELPKGIYHDLTWIQGQNLLLLSALLAEEKDFNIYQYDISQKCLKALVQNSGDDIDIAINHQQNEIIFSHRTEKGNKSLFQIYKKTFQPSSSPCITPKTSL